MPMRAETFIAQRLYYTHEAENRSSRPAIKVALLGIIIGVMVMIVTICIVVGFKRVVTEKVAGFGSHIQIVNFDSNNTYEMQPVALNDSLLVRLQSFEHVRFAEPFITKPGILQAHDNFQGIVLKGYSLPEDSIVVAQDSPWRFFCSSLTNGHLPLSPREVIISTELARLLQISIGDDIVCYFVEENIRMRKFTVCGIFSTGLSEFDKLFIIGDISVLRILNEWSDRQASGIEICVDDIKHISEVDDKVFFATANRFDSEGNAYYVQTLVEKNPQIFAWLDLLDMNVVIIIILMLCVSAFNIISGLIILILDSINMTGILKALGANNRFLRRVFIIQAGMLICRGVLLGNILGLGLCALQYYTHIIPLDSATYYVSYVPIAFPWLGWLLLNIGTIAITLLVLLAPVSIVSKISPTEVMRFK